MTSHLLSQRLPAPRARLQTPHQRPSAAARLRMIIDSQPFRADFQTCEVARVSERRQLAPLSSLRFAAGVAFIVVVPTHLAPRLRLVVLGEKGFDPCSKASWQR